MSIEAGASAGRGALVVAIGTAVSRASGVARILVVAAVLGIGALHDTYQSANKIPNVLFELLAAGALQAVLIPTIVEWIHREGDEEAGRASGAILGVATVVLAVVASLGVLAAPVIARGIFSGVADPARRAEHVALATILLRFFFPQLVLYGLGAIGTAVLNAQRRFSIPAVAPLLNNVVVIGAYVWFDAVHGGGSGDLALSPSEATILGAGTTAGVAAFCLLPLASAYRTNVRPRLSFSFRHPAVQTLVRKAAWAALYLACTQVVVVCVLVFGNRAVGAVSAYEVGYAFFLLPHALFSVPVLTSLLPRMASRRIHGSEAAIGDDVARGLRAIAFFALLAVAASVALAPALSRMRLGAVGAGDASLVAGAVAGFAPGLLGFGVFLFLTRTFYALDDARTPAYVSAAIAGAAVPVTAVAFALAPTNRAAGLAGAHSVLYLVGAALLLRLLRARLDVPRVALSLGRTAVIAAISGVLMRLVADGLDDAAPLAGVVAAGAVGLAFFAVAHALGRVPFPSLDAPIESPARGAVVLLLGPSTGGIRRHVAHLADTLRTRGWEVVIAGPDGVMGDGASQDALVTVPASLSPRSIRQIARARRQLAPLVQDAALVHAHGLKAGWLAATLRRRPPVVVTVHNVVLDEAAGRQARLLRALERRLRSRVDRILAVSDAIGEQMSAAPGNAPVDVIPPSGPLPHPRRSVAEVRTALGADAGERLVVSVARLHPQKDVPTFFRAVAEVRRRHEVRAVVIGDGPDRDALEHLRSQLGLAHVVELVPRSDDVAGVLAAADAVVVSSIWESGPLVAVEALQLGVPLVSTPVGFVPSLVVHGESALIVDVGDHGAMAVAIDLLLSDDELAARVASGGAAAVERSYDAAALVSRVEAAYRATMSGS